MDPEGREKDYGSDQSSFVCAASGARATLLAPAALLVRQAPPPFSRQAIQSRPGRTLLVSLDGCRSMAGPKYQSGRSAQRKTQ